MLGEQELQRGAAALASGQLDQATELLMAAADQLVDPAQRSELADRLLLLAQRYEQAGRDKDALSTYLKLLDTAPSVQTYLALVRTLPRHWSKALSWLNARWQLRSCTSVGRWTRVTGKLYLENRGEVVIGERVQILSHYARSVLAVFPGGRLEVGDRTVLNYGADIATTGLVRIGADCLIGTHVTILDNDFHEITDRSQRPVPRPVIIGDRAWIGNRAIVLPGVNVGDDAAVGAGSVVMTDIPSRSVAIGNPARVIKRI